MIKAAALAIALVMVWAAAHANCAAPQYQPPLTVTVLDGDTLAVRGQIVAGSAALLSREIIRHHPHTLVISSNGGSTYEASAMAEIVAARHLDVVVPTGAQCSSGCFMILAAGRVRTVAADSEIGVHRAASFCGATIADAQEATDAEAEMAIRYGATPEVIRRMTSTYQPALADLTATELAAMGVRVTRNRNDSHP